MDKRKGLSPLQIKFIHLYLEQSVNLREEIELVFLQFIQKHKTQTQGAKRLNLIQQTFNYRFNHAKKIHLEDILIMIQLLESTKTEEEKWKGFIKYLTFSKQVQMAWKDLEKSRKPRGRKSGKKMEENETHLTKFSGNFVKLTLKTVRLEEEIAIQYGFNNRETLRKAIKIWQAVKVSKTASPLLIQALDDNEIKIHKAYCFLKHSLEMQEQLVQQERLKQQNKKRRINNRSKQNDYKLLLQAFKTNTSLKAMEQKTQAPIIQCIEAILQNFFNHQEHHRHASLF